MITLDPRTATAAREACDRISAHLADPAHAGSDSGRAQSLAQGAAGTSLLHIERALTGTGTWSLARRWTRAATAHEISAGDDAALFVGAPAIAFVLHSTHHDDTARAVATLDTAVAALARRRAAAAMRRIDSGLPPRLAEYDLFHGLTGIGAHLARNRPGDDALEDILTYLVRLTTQPLRPPSGGELPGWWAAHDPDPAMPTPGGHANVGISHGVCGPLALLATTMRTGITVDGQREAIDHICAWLDDWRQHTETGPWWPQWLTHAELRSGRVFHHGPPRPSWCYGTPGIARAQHLAALATGDTTRQAHAEDALVAALTDPAQLATVTGPGLCHGIAGIHQTTWRTALDATDPRVGELLPHLTDLLLAQARHRDANPEFLDGAAGLALALHTAGHHTPSNSGWEACLMI